MAERLEHPVAHTPSEDGGEWHYLDRHSVEVAEIAAGFASRFGASPYAWWIGLLHDIAKCADGFQRYLWLCVLARREGKRAPKSDTPHAGPGAVYALKCLARAGLTTQSLVCLPIQGHHSYLHEAGESRSELSELLESGNLPLEQIEQLRDEILATLPERPPRISPRDMSPVETEFLVRMLLSTLIDADRLSTEAHFEKSLNQLRVRTIRAGELGPALFDYIESKRDLSSNLNRIRDEVYQCCIEAAKRPGGIFRLTVPTGGGKTLSSLAFALAHLAERDGFVVIALPYTSIIEQTVKAYRKVPGIGKANVLEHHSAVPTAESERQDVDSIRFQLAVENWDAPIVVTTTVQLLESLFSNRPSKVRKLHRLAGSVIILDEFQSVPPALLVPTMDVLKLLATPLSEGGYGATVVLCTATQPNLDSTQLQAVLDGVKIREMVPQYPEHFRKLKRVSYSWKSAGADWDDLSDEISQQPSALAILNTRRDALALLDAMRGTENLFHLSTLLCGAHRRKVLNDVRERLDAHLPVKLVSTQVVECGVDFDFPTVYRAVGPLDRIVQAAGRCNRNFKMDLGRVVIFEPSEGSSPNGFYKDATNKTRFLMTGRNPEELHKPELYDTYFHKLFNDQSLDGFGIQRLRNQLNFPKVAEEYRLIKEPTSPVVVKYGEEWEQNLDAFRRRPNRKAWRNLQPFMVTLFDHDLNRFKGNLEEVATGLHLWIGPYDKLTGIGMGSGAWDPSDLFVG